MARTFKFLMVAIVLSTPHIGFGSSNSCEGNFSAVSIAVPLVKIHEGNFSLVDPDTGKRLASIDLSKADKYYSSRASLILAVQERSRLNVFDRMNGRRLRTRDLSEFEKPRIALGPDRVLALTEGSDKLFFRQNRARIEHGIFGDAYQELDLPRVPVNHIGFVLGSNEFVVYSENTVYIYKLNVEGKYEFWKTKTFFDRPVNVMRIDGDLIVELENDFTIRIDE